MFMTINEFTNLYVMLMNLVLTNSELHMLALGTNVPGDVGGGSWRSLM